MPYLWKEIFLIIFAGVIYMFNIINDEFLLLYVNVITISLIIYLCKDLLKESFFNMIYNFQTWAQKYIISNIFYRSNKIGKYAMKTEYIKFIKINWIIFILSKVKFILFFNYNLYNFKIHKKQNPLSILKINKYKTKDFEILENINIMFTKRNKNIKNILDLINDEHSANLKTYNNILLYPKVIKLLLKIKIIINTCTKESRKIITEGENIVNWKWWYKNIRRLITNKNCNKKKNLRVFANCIYTYNEINLIFNNH